MGKKAFNVLWLTVLLGIAACSSDDIQDEPLLDDDSYFDEEVYVPDTLLLDSLDWKAVNMPPAPDYSDPSMWFIREAQLGDAGVDVFYTCPTEIITDYISGWKTYGHMNVYDDNQRKAFSVDFDKAMPVFGITANFYSFYYRQATLQSFASENTLNTRFPYAFQDIKRAFNYYLEHFNNGRPFIIAGYSQGGKATVEMLKELQPSHMKRLVAAYVIGYKITEEDLLSPNIVPATGAFDVGVTCCFSSVGDERSIWPIIQEPVACAINPVNWKTDDTPAEIPWVQRVDSDRPVTVRKDMERNIMFVDNYIVEDFGFYPVTWIMGEKNYHRYEFTLYAPSIVQNIADRIVAFQSIPTGIKPIKW